MTFKPGDVVMLKSGGQAMTVASVDDEEIGCVWVGEEGDLFREALPAVTLEVAHLEGEGGRFPGKLPDGSAREVRIVANGVALWRAN